MKKRSAKFVFLNGKIVPEEKAVVSVFDRGFQLGDGLFETMRVYRGRPFLWEAHLARLRRGAEFVGISLPMRVKELRVAAGQLIRRNGMPEALLRIGLSRGIGPRGYSPRGARHPTLVMSLHPVPESCSPPPHWSLISATPRLPAREPLAQFKTCNKLPQILARMEADEAGADEALLLNTDGECVEGGSSNLFWVARGCICTPALVSGILAGVTRDTVKGLCRKLGISCRESAITPRKLLAADGVFMTLTSRGVVEVAKLDGKNLSRSPLTEKIRLAYEVLIKT